jgi:hypothetical protein
MATVLEWESRQFRPNTPAAFFIELKHLALANFGPSISEIVREFELQPMDWVQIKSIALNVGSTYSDADIQKIVGSWSRIENGLRELAISSVVPV